MMSRGLNNLFTLLLSASFLFILASLFKFQSVPSISKAMVYGNETMGPPSTPRFYDRQETFLLSRRISINRPAEQVYQAVLSPQLWTLCYPETLAVAGVSKRRVRPGDVIIEKFLFNGMFYVMFRYDVESADPDSLVLFHGIIVFANSILQRLFPTMLQEIGGSFDYKFEVISPGVTEWQRDLYLYTTSKSLIGKALFWLVVTWIRETQERGATQFVECTKLMLESFNGDLWADLK
jgi:hypothetical protein